ncbi:MAG TPA: hypothetical protein VFM25_03960 [Verrucomicrobiae bacterium]|nr:hypothetical protein [Verrucomicrobiae bacterium]
MKTYSVSLNFVQYNRADILIKARSLKHAERLADEIGSDEVDEWSPVDGEVSVESVHEVKPRRKARR